MRLSDEIQEIMRQPVDWDPKVLESVVEGPVPISHADGLRIMTANLEGMHRGMERLSGKAKRLDAGAARLTPCRLSRLTSSDCTPQSCGLPTRSRRWGRRVSRGQELASRRRLQARSGY
jgi:hypothetical protein